MNSEIKYPAIYANGLGCNILWFSENKGVSLDDGGLVCKESTSKAANITHEYLSNTWGVVESKEHAEFIVELCRVNDIEIFNIFDDGITHFIIAKSEVIFTYGTPTTSVHDKQITIPLPPSASVDELTPEEEFELHQNQAVQALNSEKEYSKRVFELGCYNLNCRSEFVDMETWPQVGDPVTTYGQQGDVILPADKNGFYIINADGLYLAAKAADITKSAVVESEDTWPEVGDKVSWGACELVGIVKAVNGDQCWVLRPDNDCMTIRVKHLTKPKSKEDLLIEELQAKLCENNYVDNYTLANDIVNGMIEGLVYEPK